MWVEAVTRQWNLALQLSRDVVTCVEGMATRQLPAQTPNLQSHHPPNLSVQIIRRTSQTLSSIIYSKLLISCSLSLSSLLQARLMLFRLLRLQAKMDQGVQPGVPQKTEGLRQ